tara:strand:- start:4860 stop:5054 length:195 start_codon:yes stop_codon:yes gene_type:complete
MIETTAAMFITFGACIVTYFWGRSQISMKNIDEITENTITVLEKGGYIKTKEINGEKEIVKISD